MNKPLSENIAHYSAGDHHVTAAIWRTRIESEWFDTFEIGIRETVHGGKFWLLQGDWNYQSVQEVANAIAMLLADKTQCYSPEWCKEHFT